MGQQQWALVVTSLLVVAAPSGYATDADSLPGSGTAGREIARQCVTDLQAFDREMEEAGFGVLPPDAYGASARSGYYVYGATGTPRQKIRAFRDAAYAYAEDGDEKSCQALVASMREAYAHHQALVGTEADSPGVRAAWRRAHLARAQPVGEMTRLMRADIVIGADIRNTQDKKLGEIEDVVIDPRDGGVAYVLASRGGFLGVGAELVAVRWRDLRATEDHEIYVLDVSESVFDKAPTIGKRNFAESAGQVWRDSLNRYWDENIKP